MLFKIVFLLCICTVLIEAQRPNSLPSSSLDNTSSRTNFSNLRNQGLNFPTTNSNFDSASRPFGSLGSIADLNVPNSEVGLNPLLNTRLGMFNQNPYNQLVNQQMPYPYNQYPYNQYPYNQYPISTFMPQQLSANGNGLGLSQLEMLNTFPLTALYVNQLRGGIEPFYNNLLLSNRLQMQGYLTNQLPVGSSSVMSSSKLFKPLTKPSN